MLHVALHGCSSDGPTVPGVMGRTWGKALAASSLGQGILEEGY